MSKNILKQVRTKTLNWVIGATLMFTPAVSFGQAELPFTMTEAALNEGVNVTASGEATPYWDSNYNGIHFGGSGAFSSSGGWDWDDKYVIIKLKDIPKALIFSGDQSGAATGVEWYVATSKDGSDYTNVIWSSTSKPSNKSLDLPESAKFVKICYSGNLEGWIYDVSIEAKYCTFKVISDGVIKITESIKPNYPIPAVDNNQTKECHTFSGWDKEIPTIMPNEDFTLTALFNVIKYTSHFKIKNEELGVTMLEDFDISFDCGKPLDVDTPKHEGVKFKEWQPELPSIADELIKGATYTAQWELLDFPVYITITKDSIIEKRFLYGEQVVIEEPQLKGYTFRQWSPNPPSKMPAKAFEIEAILDPNKYPFILNKGYETTPAADTTIYTYKESIGNIKRPAREGYTFIGWNPEIPETMPADTFRTTAQWEVNKYRHVVYTSETDSVETLVNYGETLEPLAEPFKEGYSFKGWDIEQPQTMPAKDLIIRAMWEVNSYKFELYDGDVLYKAYTFNYNDSIKFEDYQEPTKVGYTFKGWNEEFPEVMPAEDLKYAAKWSINQYRYVVYTSQTDSTEDVVNFGETLDPLPELNKEGYTFKSWDIEQPQTMPANDLIIRAIWEVNSYKLELYDGEELLKAYTFNYNDSIKFEDYQEPTKVGYTFKGWNEEFPEVMPAEDLKYTAEWEKNQYRHVVYRSENDSTEKIVTFGETLNLLPEPTRDGYTFKGWDIEQPKTMPGNDLIIRAIWEVNSYKLELYDGESLLKTYVFNFNDSIKLNDYQDPTKEGNTFLGWDKDFAKVMPAKDLKYTAQWSVNQYKIVVYTSATDSVIDSYNYGDTVKVVEAGTKEGHTFKAWDKEFPVTMPAENIIIHAIWEVNQYSITFLVDNEEYQSYRFDFDSLIVLNEYKDPTKEGYTFNGWGIEIPERMPAKNLTLEAQWEINQYNITWVVDPNNPETNYTTKNVNFGTTIKEEDAPTREGYTFVRWEGVPETMPAKDITITAVWNINRYKLNFYSDGALYLKQVYEYDETIDYASIPAPVKEGYQFLGWEEKPSKMPAEDVTITAKWAISTHELVIITDKENPSSNDTIYYNFGTKIEAIETPEKEGYSFLGWDVKIPETMPNNSVVITAQWSINNYTLTTLINCVPTTYTYTFGDSITIADPFVEGYDFVKWTPEMPKVMPGQSLLVIADIQPKQYNFIINSDEKPDTITYNFNDVIAEVETPEKEGHTFMGWSEAIPETMPAKDLTIDALWEANSYNIHYLSDGDTLLSTTCKYGTTISTLKAPTKVGYTFADWYDEDGGVVPASMPAYDLTLTASWDVNSYYFAVITNNDTTSQKYEYMEKLAKPAIPTRRGYTFAEWNKEIPNNMPAYNDTIKALWDINSYNVTWIVDEDSTTITYDYQETIKKAKDPEKLGYTFIGWDQFIAETMPDKDLFYTAVFDVNNYQFIIHVDDKKEVVSYPYNNEIALPENPTKEGYTFTGWSETIPEKMPAHNVEVFAQFSTDTFQLNIKAENETITYNYPYGSKIQTIIAPVIAGKEFDRWSEDLPSTMPANDVTIEALYKANSYQLIVITGEETEIKYYQFGEEVEKPSEPTKEGYTFVGWDAEYPTVMPNKNVVVTAQWKANVYDFVVIVGEDTTTTAYTYNETIKKPATPEKEGYIFEGWDIEIPYSMPAENVTIEAKFVVAEFTLTTIVENIKTEVIYDFGQEINTPKKPTRKGYTFKGWSVEIPETMPARDIVAEAKWEVNQYNLMVIVDEDTTTITYDYNSIIEKPAIPEKEGYIFVGWNTEIPYTMPAEDVSIKAEFAIDEFRFTTIVEGVITEETYKFGEEIKAPKEPTREGYTFNGWSIEIPKTMPAKDIVAEAEWEVNQYNLMVIVDEDTTTTSYDYNSIIEKPAIPEKEGYIFVGWNTEIPYTMPAEDVTIEAEFAIDEFRFTTIVEGVITEETYKFGEEVKAPKEPTREGYAFNGWSIEIPKTMPAKDLVVEAEWEVNQYTVTFIADKDTVQTDKYDFGANVEEISIGDKEGYTFVGWDAKVPSQMPAEDLTFHAVWEAKKYNFVYEIEGEVFTYEYSFGDTIKLPDTPTRTGYTFIGWSKEIPSIMGDRNIVINAQWRVNKYAVTRTIEGVTKTDSVAFGEHLDIETPVKTGYAFKGWDIEVPENMPAKNLKMVAKFEPLGKLMTWTEHEKLFVTGLAEDVEIFIFDWTGKVLYNGKEREFELPTGVYIIQANEEYKKAVVQ